MSITNEPKVKSYNLLEKLPNLQNAKIISIDLTSEYWTPIEAGEFKLCFFQELKNSSYTDETGHTIELPCVVFIDQDENLKEQTFRNGSKRLYAAIETAKKNGLIVPGTPLRIEYLGKHKNLSNDFYSDTWSVKRLDVQNNEEKQKELDELFLKKESLIPTSDFEHIKRIIENKEITSYDKTLKFLRNL